MQKIPKIIHQIWSGKYNPLPKHFRMMGETWKEHHPDWDYQFWDEERMNRFIHDYYPQYWDIYLSFPYDVQRWDAIRYLILDRIGGMYVDFDVECLKPHDQLFMDKTCCFSAEPERHRERFKRDVYFNNALMACVPEHPFMKIIVDKVFSYKPSIFDLPSSQRFFEIMTTTGPLLLVDIYEKYPHKDKIFIIQAKHVSPFDVAETSKIRQGFEFGILDDKLREAFSIHYFFGGWLPALHGDNWRRPNT